jgi:hypothetical protein
MLIKGAAGWTPTLVVDTLEAELTPGVDYTSQEAAIEAGLSCLIRMGRAAERFRERPKAAVN